MRVHSVNLGPARPLTVGKRERKTGIFKIPSAKPVAAGPLGLEGDQQVNKKHHGGPDQAVYVYHLEDYSWWSEQLGRTLEAGVFGENLTLEGAQEKVNIGDRLRIGQVLLEVTAPRIPCNTLAARMDDPGFVKRFSQARRPGYYTRVLDEGYLEAGMPVAYQSLGQLPLLELFELTLDAKADPARLQRALQAPLAQRARELLEKRLATV